MKKFAVVLVLALLALALCGCQSADTDISAAGGSVQSDPLSLPESNPEPDLSLPEGYDPASEEDSSDTDYDPERVYNDLGQQVYAGATPIPLDPIDMPAPTPKPTLTFSYGVVTSDALRLSFEAPAGWQIDASASDAIVLINPETLDGINATITLRMNTVASGFKLSDLRTTLKDTLKEMGRVNYDKWSTTETASRTLLKKDGFYADFEGTYYDGSAVYGRLMMALLDNNQVLSLQIICPDGYFNSSYKTVINHVRDTLKQQ